MTLLKKNSQAKLVNINNNGFSLAEMMVVLVIIGLITSAIFVGQRVIQSASTRAIISELNHLSGAMIAFQTRYRHLAGDFSKASSYFTECQAMLLDACNGNGNGRVGALDTAGSEPYLLWRHLYYANLYTSNFSVSNMQGSFKNTPIIGQTIAGSAVDAVGYDIRYYSEPIYRQLGHFAVVASLNETRLDAGALSAVDTQRVDQKIDDGSPVLGSVLGVTGIKAEQKCTRDGAYALEHEQTNCRIFMALHL